MNNAKNCKGKVFRCYIDNFISDQGSFVYQMRMHPLKTMSCPGCKKCKLAGEYLADITFDNTLIPVMTNIEHMALYSLMVIDEREIYESAPDEDYDDCLEVVNDDWEVQMKHDDGFGINVADGVYLEFVKIGISERITSRGEISKIPLKMRRAHRKI